MNEHDFGLRLRTLRHMRRETLEQVSEATGLSVAMLSRVERGERLPSPESVESLAKHFGLPVEELMSETIANRMLNRYGRESSQHAAEKMRSESSMTLGSTAMADYRDEPGDDAFRSERAARARSYGIFSQTPIGDALGPAASGAGRRTPPRPHAQAAAMPHRDLWIPDESPVMAESAGSRPEDRDALADAAHVAEVALLSALAAARRAKASGDPEQTAQAERVLERLRRALGEG